MIFFQLGRSSRAFLSTESEFQGPCGARSPGGGDQAPLDATQLVCGV